MTWDAWELYNNFDAFVAELEISQDWRMIVANKDSGYPCEFARCPRLCRPLSIRAIQLNWDNDYTEALLTVNESAIQQTDV